MSCQREGHTTDALGQSVEADVSVTRRMLQQGTASSDKGRHLQFPILHLKSERNLLIII